MLMVTRTERSRLHSCPQRTMLDTRWRCLNLVSALVHRADRGVKLTMRSLALKMMASMLWPVDMGRARDLCRTTSAALPATMKMLYHWVRRSFL